MKFGVAVLATGLCLNEANATLDLISSLLGGGGGLLGGFQGLPTGGVQNTFSTRSSKANQNDQRTFNSVNNVNNSNGLNGGGLFGLGGLAQLCSLLLGGGLGGGNGGLLNLGGGGGGSDLSGLLNLGGLFGGLGGFGGLIGQNGLFSANLGNSGSGGLNLAGLGSLTNLLSGGLGSLGGGLGQLGGKGQSGGLGGFGGLFGGKRDNKNTNTGFQTQFEGLNNRQGRLSTSAKFNQNGFNSETNSFSGSNNFNIQNLDMKTLKTIFQRLDPQIQKQVLQRNGISRIDDLDLNELIRQFRQASGESSNFNIKGGLKGNNLRGVKSSISFIKETQDPDDQYLMQNEDIAQQVDD